MANDTEDLKGKTLAQLEAIRTQLTSADWQMQMMSCGVAEQSQNSDLLILLDARIAQLEDVQFAQIQKHIDACQVELHDAISGVQNALLNIRDVGQVLTTAGELLTVVGKIFSLR